MKRYWNFESFTLRFEFSSSKFSLNYKNWCWKGEIISEVTSLHLGPTMETTTLVFIMFGSNPKELWVSTMVQV
jgi:hypothetical protein